MVAAVAAVDVGGRGPSRVAGAVQGVPARQKRYELVPAGGRGLPQADAARRVLGQRSAPHREFFGLFLKNVWTLGGPFVPFFDLF